MTKNKTSFAKDLSVFEKADLITFIIQRHFRVAEVVTELKFIRWDRKSKQARSEMDAATTAVSAARTHEELMAAHDRFTQAMRLSARAEEEFDKK